MQRSDAHVIIDDRESRLFESACSRHVGLSISKKRLLTGDIHILRGNVIALVLERKSRSDLKASLIDGRFHAQRARMVEEYGSDRVAFIVEGGTSWSSPESGAEIGIIMRDHLSIFWSNDVNDTADLVSRLAIADITARDEPPVRETRACLATTKCPTKSLASILRCVPGVSSVRAAAIATEFKSVIALCEAITTDPTEVVARISQFRSTSEGKRFGPALANRVVMCLGHPCDTTTI